MFVWGHHHKDVVTGSGLMHCPHCERERPYQKIELQKINTIYWVIPVGRTTIEASVRCLGCGTYFDPKILAAMREAGLLRENAY